ncbi:MAG: DoxX family protein [Petrimonas mucosa]|uniref:DoxX family protein n=1 Tax=Petrimonas mucosa TaxID=1642646 RepID=UPI003D93AFD3
MVKWFLTLLRVVLGWYFLYEGISKILLPGWTSKNYLMGSTWILSDLFHWLASFPVRVEVVDFLNVWGLILIGASLFVGLLVRWSSIFAAILLIFYFVAYPPIPGYTFGTVTEGSYLWVNKTLIEFFLLVLFIFLPAASTYGLDRLIAVWKEERARRPVPRVSQKGAAVDRRELLKDLISVPFIGAFAYAYYKKRRWSSFEEKYLSGKPDTVSSATIRSFTFTSLDNLKGCSPKGKIGNIGLSRLIIGGNLIGGWAHSRDLIYVSKLVKAYHTDEKVMMTLQLAEKCGIDTLLCNPQLARIINKYWRETKGKIQFLSDCGHKDGFLEGIRISQEAGAIAMYCQGEMADRLVRDGKLSEISDGVKLIRSYGKPAGIGAHRLETIKACVENGIRPDFWVKTLHHHNYWSAQPNAEWHDNIYCFEPQETIDYMNRLEEPWIAFKVLAAGAIDPKDGFKYAFDNGADFICVGMYDFQIVDDTNILLDTLSNVQRVRPWRG